MRHFYFWECRGGVELGEFGVALGIDAFDEAFEGEEGEVLEDGRGVEGGALDELFDGCRLGMEMLEDGLLGFGKVGGGHCGGLRGGGDGWWGRYGIREGVESCDDVLEAGCEDGAIADELVCTGGHVVIDASGDSEDGSAVVFVGEASGDERAAALVGFDDEDAAGHSGDEAIAAWEVFGGGRCTEGEFGDECTALGDLFEE